ncbi:alpha-(1,3)-fucosyltransferase fut-3-like [Haliotis rubra]|uniref:alpha-(1,3)-fucosyltransferase fut-3-like n=1 Tax=Haliotis rubra TaxID=36100 RepID=UPI001EE58F9F|nr:alpha-(1,3)-fucosyltransferase fut-3-like [Haliotis rubra]XP_046579276.1 alpha-(1,3)-fucosyltransferase fut-3-like [Haliotis rubra]
MRCTTQTLVKLFLCVVITIFICRYFYTNTSHSIPLNDVPTVEVSPPTVKPLPYNIARIAFKEYHPSGDQRGDKVKLIFAYAPDLSYARRDQHIYPLNCGDVRCASTTRGTYLRDSHAVMFSSTFLERHPLPKIDRRLHGKVFLFFENRPHVPEIARKLESTLSDKSVFNWTIGYTRDADIRISYGTIVKKKAVPLYNLTTVVSRKKRTVVIFQQSCKTPSRLEEYLQQLRKYVKVDVYGPCVNRTLCNQDLDCFIKVGREYKFYLAFEEVFCSEYISNVFFRFYGTETVPIVRGGGDYSNVVPKGTYINTADYKSIAELGRYIQYLDKNDTAYIEILKKKRYYDAVYSRQQIVRWEDKKFIRHIYMNMGNMMCDICKRLWNVDDYRKTYSDILSWYGSSKCTKPLDLESRKPVSTRASNSTAVIN